MRILELLKHPSPPLLTLLTLSFMKLHAAALLVMQLSFKFNGLKAMDMGIVQLAAKLPCLVRVGTEFLQLVCWRSRHARRELIRRLWPSKNRRHLTWQMGVVQVPFVKGVQPAHERVSFMSMPGSAHSGFPIQPLGTCNSAKRKVSILSY